MVISIFLLYIYKLSMSIMYIVLKQHNLHLNIV